VNPRYTFFRLVFWRIIWWLCFITLVPVHRVWATGFWRLPRRGSYMLLGNHTTMLDPFLMGLWCWRPVHFMTSAHWYRSPILKPLLNMIGAFSKTKFTRDPESMRQLAGWHARGEIVSLFPEGRRTWDGRTLAVLPHIGRLIQRLQIPVVFCRYVNGYYAHPRWAFYPRFVATRLVFDGPVYFPATATEEEIEAEVQRRIHVDASRVPPPRWAFGVRLAWGLPNALWACPTCFCMESIRVHPRHGNQIGCLACGSSWRLDVANRLHPLSGRAAPHSVTGAMDRIRDHFGTPPIADRLAFDMDGVVLRDENTTLREVRDRASDASVLAHGTTVLTPDVLATRGIRSFETALCDITTVSIENIRVLQFRTGGRLLQLDIPGRSVLRWQHFLNPWRERAGVTVLGADRA
jgi:1-acyl-sn-glycerol-3-phosphate acyltransferase